MDLRKTVSTAFLIALLTVVLFAGVWQMQIEPAYAITLFDDGFEVGNGYTPWTTTSGTPTIVTAPVHHGVNASQCNADTEYSSFTISSNRDTYTRFYVNFTVLPVSGDLVNFIQHRGSTYILARVGLGYSGGANWSLIYRSAGTYLTVYSNQQYPVANTYHCVELRSYACSANGVLDGAFQVWIDDVELMDIAQTDVDTVETGTLQIRVGTPNMDSMATTAYLDCVKIGTAYINPDTVSDTTFPTYDVYGSNETICNPSKQVAVYSSWNDNEAMDKYAIQHNNTGPNVNITGSVSSGWANGTITLNDTECVVAVKIFANDTANNWNVTSTFYIYVLSATDYKHEIRGMFIHEGTLNGATNNWTAIAENLANYNFTDVYVQWGSATRYNSFLASGGVTNIATTISVFHSYGLRIHYCAPILGDAAGNVSWTTYRSNGTVYSWNCPLNPLFRAAVQTHMENVSSYDFDGIMLDYIRYDVEDQCYCTYCRAAFETWLGSNITDWTQYYKDGVNFNQWREWRTIPVTNLVSDIKTWTLAINPDLKFSAAVYCLWTNSGEYQRKFLGQDTGLWIKNNYLDMVSPMMYTVDPTEFEAYVTWSTYFWSNKVHVLPFIRDDLANFTAILSRLRSYPMSGFIMWKYAGDGDSSVDTYYNTTRIIESIASLTGQVPPTFEIYSISSTRLSSTSFSVEWYTNSSTTALLEYKSSDLFTYSWNAKDNFNYWWIQHSQGTLVVNMTHSTYHKFTLTGLTEDTIYYFRAISIGSGNYTSLEYTLSLSGVTVTITSPTNTTYTDSSILVSLSASGGTIDKIIWNVTYIDGVLAKANATYTVTTSMVLGNGEYLLRVFANNTDGDVDTAFVYFTVSITIPAPSEVSITLNSPANGATSTSLTVSFVYTPIVREDVFYHAELWLNLSGIWQIAAYNSSLIANYTTNSISYVFSGNNTYLWNIKIWNSTTGVFATSTRILTIAVAGIDWYSLTVNCLDLSSANVNAYVTKRFYNSSDLLTYTEGSYSLLSGTITVKAYYLDMLVNSTDFVMVTYGNTTVSLNVNMRALSLGGYLAVNKSASITFKNQTSTLINATITAAGTFQVACLVPANASLVQLDGVNVTDWLFNATNLSLRANLTSGDFSMTFAETLGEPWFGVTVGLVSLGSLGGAIWYYRRAAKKKSKVVPAG